MPWKTDSNGQLVVSDGNPVWIYGDGKESPFDAGSAIQNIGSLTSESISRKNKIKELETKFSAFQDIQDPLEFLNKAKSALDTVQNMKDKDYIAAGEVEKLKKSVAESYESRIREMDKSYKTQLEDRENQIKTKEAGMHQLVVKNAFNQISDFLKQKTVLSPILAFDSFGKYFTVEEIDGTPQAIAVRNGEKLFSMRNPGSPASPDEALEILINERPDKDAILRGQQGGSGSRPNIGSGSNMSDLLKLSPTERINAARRQQK